MLLKRPHRLPRQKSPQLLDHSGSEEGCYHWQFLTVGRGIKARGGIRPLCVGGLPVPAIVLPDDMMTSLVIGATGIVGGYICSRLLQAGERPIALSRSTRSSATEVEWLKGDLAEPAFLKLPRGDYYWSQGDLISCGTFGHAAHVHCLCFDCAKAAKPLGHVRSPQ
jgi:hypothetical protein